MTAPNPFAAAIIQLRIFAGIKPVREHEFLSISYGDSPKVPVHQKDIHAAIRVLEAAGEMPQAKERLLPHFEELAHIQCFYCKGIRALIAALPDKEKP